jgi:hypothetical protein
MHPTIDAVAGGEPTGKALETFLKIRDRGPEGYLGPRTLRIAGNRAEALTPLPGRAPSVNLAE